MVDLGRPPTFGDSEGVIDFVEIPNFFQSGPASQAEFDFYTTEGNLYWRPRFVSIFGDASGTVGSMSIAFQGLTSGLVGPPWPVGGPLVAPSSTNVAFQEAYAYSWSTEVGNSYSNVTASFGRTAVVALPLVYLPRLTTFSVIMSRVGGYDGDYNIDGGMMQLERFLPSQVGGGSGAYQLWLQPVA